MGFLSLDVLDFIRDLSTLENSSVILDIQLFAACNFKRPDPYSSDFLLVFGTSGEGHREGDLRSDSAEDLSLEAEHLMFVSNMSLSFHYCLTKKHHVQ